MERHSLAVIQLHVAMRLFQEQAWKIFPVDLMLRGNEFLRQAGSRD